MSDIPVFAVVGHPNKGKSSIVSTLASDDTVRIGAIPGTTVQCRRYPMKVDGVPLYELVDTPGFQRARKALNWMMDRKTTAADHATIVRQFVEQFKSSSDFLDECELLAPLVEGAGILYVVDGSVPYGPEYEAEMKILRWTGQPSMGLINPIGPSDHVDEWRAALRQFFSVVRVFDALHTSFAKRIELLTAFGQLREEWRTSLASAVQSLQADRARRRARSARAVAETIVRMMTLEVEATSSTQTTEPKQKTRLEHEYLDELRGIENKCRDCIEEIYDHHHLQRSEAALEALVATDLFSDHTWQLFGLNRRQLMGLGAIGGGTLGGIIDIASGGSSLLLGTLIGSGVGATTSLLTAKRMVEVKILHLSVGSYKLIVGPTQNLNFPHILFNRARLHHTLIAGRTHAERDILTLDPDLETTYEPLSTEQRRRIEKLFSKTRRGWNNQTAQDSLQQIITEIFAADDEPRK